MTIVKTIFKSITRPSLHRDAGLYTAFNAAAALFPFFVTLILTRLVLPADYGLYGIVLVAVTLVTPLVSMGVETAIGRRFVDRTDIDFPRYVSTAVLISFAFAIGAFVVAHIAQDYLFELFPLPSPWLWAWIVVAWSQVLLTTVLTLLQMEQKPVEYGFWRVARAGGIQVVIGVTAVMGLVTWQALVMSLAIANIALTLSCLVWLRNRGYGVVRFSLHDARAALRYGAPLLPHMLSASILLAAGPFFLAAMKGVEAAGIYTVGLTLSQVMTMIGGALNRAWTPWYYQKMKTNGTNSRYAIARGGTAFISCMLLAGTGLALIGWLVFPWIVGADYTTAALIFVWLVGAWTAHNILGLVSSYLYYTHRTGWISGISIVAISVNLSLTPIFIRTYGSAGAAAAVCIAYVTALALGILVTGFFATTLSTPEDCIRESLRGD